MIPLGIHIEDLFSALVKPLYRLREILSRGWQLNALSCIPGNETNIEQIPKMQCCTKDSNT